MQIVSGASRLSRALKSTPVFVYWDRFLGPEFLIGEAPYTSFQCWNQRRLSSLAPHCAEGIIQDRLLQGAQYNLIYSMESRASFSTKINVIEGSSNEVAKVFYDKMLHSVVTQRSMPPNAWLWSLIENCKTRDDIKLLFDILQNLRRFRLSNLRIHDNFNCNLCREVTKACARVGALDFGKIALRNHNVYGLTPSIGSAHHLLLYAEEHNDAKLMIEIVKLLERNDLPLQSGTADIVFRICYKMENWDLTTKYSKKFIKSGIKLRQTTYEVLMDFASKMGDVESMWEIEKLRSDSMKQHTLVTGFSCAKGFLLERKPEEAAALLELLHGVLSDKKKALFVGEMQKLVSEWPLQVTKHQKEENRKAFAASLHSTIKTMVTCLQNSGFNISINMDELIDKESVPS